MIFRIFNKKKTILSKFLNQVLVWMEALLLREMKIMVIFKNKNSYDYFLK